MAQTLEIFRPIPRSVAMLACMLRQSYLALSGTYFCAPIHETFAAVVLESANWISIAQNTTGLCDIDSY